MQESSAVNGSSEPLEGSTIDTVTGMVLAGGKSRRMGGVNKALVEVGGAPIVQRTVQVLSSIFHDLMIITNTPDDFAFLGIPMFADLKPGSGSLGGLYTGLYHMRTDHAFLVACDMPFLNEQVIRRMTGMIQHHDVVIPRIDGWLEPLHAAYSRQCIAHIRRALENGEMKIVSFFADVDVIEVPQEQLAVFDPQFRFIMNLNTPEDVTKARMWAQKSKGLGTSGAGT